MDVRSSTAPTTTLVAAAATFTLAVTVAALLALPDLTRFAIVGCLVVAILGFVEIGAPALLPILVCWLAFLGLTRRTTTIAFGGSGAFDLLLLVGPIVMILLTVTALRKGALRDLSPLAKAVGLLSILVFLEAFNLGSGVGAGPVALIFFVPLLMFWVGRVLVDDLLFCRILILIAFLSLPAAAYGLYQLFVSFPAWDRRWISESGYRALNVGVDSRPFSVFSSSTDYALYLVVAMLITLVFCLSSQRFILALAVIAFLGPAMFLVGSRGPVVALVATAVFLMMARAGWPMFLAASASIAALAALMISVSAFVPSSATSGQAGALINRQLSGIADPTGQDSTGLEHLKLIGEGLKSGLTNPLGDGVASITIAGSKFGVVSGSTEFDLSNAAKALGPVGFLLFAAVTVLGVTATYRHASLSRDALSLAVLGVVVVMFGSWLNGGLYAVAWLPWLCLGWVDAHRGRA